MDVVLLDVAAAALSCSRMFSEDFVERGDGGVDVGALQNVRRQEAQHRIAGAVDEDVALEHFGDGELGEVGGIELGGEHQAFAADVDDGAVARGERAQLGLEVVADFGCVGEEVFLFDVVDDGDGDGAGQRASAEGGAVHAGVDGARGFFGAEDCAEGNAAGEGLGEGGDVGLNAVVLIGAPLAGAAHAGLNFIDDEQRAGGAGEGAGFGEELLREGTNAAFALDGFDEDGADFVGEFGAQIGNVVEADELDAGNDGAKGLAVLGLVGGGHGAEGAAVEALLEGEELGADLLPSLRCRPAWARASFSAPSQASVPVLAKKTRSRPVRSVRRRASSAWPS